MAYLGLSPDYPDQYFTSPGEPLTCGDYCATKKAGLYAMQYLPRPEGCTCPDEIDAKKQPTLMPIQQAPAQNGGLALAAIAALLLLG